MDITRIREYLDSGVKWITAFLVIIFLTCFPHKWFPYVFCSLIGIVIILYIIDFYLLKKEYKEYGGSGE